MKSDWKASTTRSVQIFIIAHFGRPQLSKLAFIFKAITNGTITGATGSLSFGMLITRTQWSTSHTQLSELRRAVCNIFRMVLNAFVRHSITGDMHSKTAWEKLCKASGVRFNPEAAGGWLSAQLKERQPSGHGVFFGTVSALCGVGVRVCVRRQANISALDQEPELLFCASDRQVKYTVYTYKSQRAVCMCRVYCYVQGFHF